MLGHLLHQLLRHVLGVELHQEVQVEEGGLEEVRLVEDLLLQFEPSWISLVVLVLQAEVPGLPQSCRPADQVKQLLTRRLES